jgi:hypothetical protein
VVGSTATVHLSLHLDPTARVADDLVEQFARGPQALKRVDPRCAPPLPLGLIKVIGRFPGETAWLSLCWAVLDIFIAGARGLA